MPASAQRGLSKKKYGHSFCVSCRTIDVSHTSSAFSKVLKLKNSRKYRRNCPMCSLLRHASENQSYDYGDGRASFWIQRKASGQQRFSVIDARATGDIIGDDRRAVLEKNAMLTLHVFKSDESLLLSELSGNAAALAPRFTVSQILDWFHTCHKSHKECRLDISGSKIETSPQMPTRVIDVTAGNMRLHITNGRTGQYLALSHRWGPSTLQASTTKSNWQSRESGIDTESLSATMKDAIGLTRRLGLRYIWIDSLCIIQDDREDWEREAKAMASVYEKALLTLAATAGNDGTGLFVQSNLDLLTAMPCRPADPDSKPVYFTEHQTGIKGWDTFVLDAPLNARAWVMQERILSRRIVHFAADQLYWECRRQRQSQTGINYIDKLSSTHPASIINSDRYVVAGDADVHSFVTRMEQLLTTHGSKISSNPALRGAFGSLWMTLVEAYAKCSLTAPLDKLPALTGLAIRLQAAAGLSHIWGHWFHGLQPLTPLLLWYAPGFSAWKEKNGASPPGSGGRGGGGGGGGLTRPTAPRCPSWSWAAMDGEVSFLTRGEYGSPKAVLERIEPAPRDGMANHASLIFRGRLFAAVRDAARNRGGGWSWDSWRSYGYRAADAPPRASAGRRLGRVFFDADDEEPETFDCVVMCRGDAHHEGEHDRVLVLKKVACRGGRAEYRRIAAGTLDPVLLPECLPETVFALV